MVLKISTCPPSVPNVAGGSGGITAVRPGQRGRSSRRAATQIEPGKCASFCSLFRCGPGRRRNPPEITVRSVHLPVIDHVPDHFAHRFVEDPLVEPYTVMSLITLSATMCCEGFPETLHRHRPAGAGALMVLLAPFTVDVDSLRSSSGSRQLR